MPKNKKTNGKVKKVTSKAKSATQAYSHKISEQKQFGILVLLTLLGAVVVLYMIMVMRFPSLSQKYTPDSYMPQGFTIGNFVAQLIEQNNSGQFGNVALSEMSDGVEFAISLNNSPRGVAQSAFVSVGTCIDTGAAQYTLNSVVNGQSKTKIKTTLTELREKSPLSVYVVSSSRQNMKVACSNLPL